MVEDALAVLGVDAADADGFDIWMALGETGEDGADTCDADDAFAVFFAVVGLV